MRLDRKQGKGGSSRRGGGRRQGALSGVHGADGGDDAPIDEEEEAAAAHGDTRSLARDATRLIRALANLLHGEGGGLLLRWDGRVSLLAGRGGEEEDLAY